MLWDAERSTSYHIVSFWESDISPAVGVESFSQVFSKLRQCQQRLYVMFVPPRIEHVLQCQQQQIPVVLCRWRLLLTLSLVNGLFIVTGFLLNFKEISRIFFDCCDFAEPYSSTCV